MPEYKKVGYLTTDFKMFHLKDEEMRSFHYHYHDFHKILILLNGDVTYCIEGRSYDLKKNDIVLVHAGEVQVPCTARSLLRKQQVRCRYQRSGCLPLGF